MYVLAGRLKMLTIKVMGIHADGAEEYLTVRAMRIVCPCCDGTGRHVNPAIDGHGLSSDELDEDPDFREAYFSGAYDVVCEECHGRNVVEVIDWDALTPEHAQMIEDAAEEARASDLERLAEQRMGC
jgi:RecJ-like exonuclease